ncbi:hypothetical protein ACFRSX_30875 [Streptomyces goshikiensis]|uniref:hypothetical protein n=1 Tax=Streptomyces TaxID=1883 RepID=UPI000C271869|nr:hypothetical protein [Streptomyces sp. CB02120-2]PJN14656.1 hypothetical protein CG724_33830 [Streptomyces sp. CB02120-2]
MGKQREFYDEQAAAGRLGVPVAAWRWAAGSGLVPPADAGPGQWLRSAVDGADAEGVRAALRGPMTAGQAADRLTEALGQPLPRCRPRVTATAVGHLVKAGLLVWLGGEAGCPDVHPDQLAALARRRDLPALLDRHVPFGPDQAAVRLGVRRVDFDQVVRLGWISPAGSVMIDYKSHGGWTKVPLYSGVDLALLPVLRPGVDWEALRTVPAGRRSPLAGLAPVEPGRDVVLLAEVARIARVGRAAVANWRRRHADFPAPVGGTDIHLEFNRSAVASWLLDHDKIEIPSQIPPAMLLLGGGEGATRLRLDGPLLLLADDAQDEDQLTGWTTEDDADTLAKLTAGEFGASLRRLAVPGAAPLAVPGEVRLIDLFRNGSGGLKVTLAWPAALRGAASDSQAGGVVRHGLAYAGPGEACVCRRHACGGVVPVSWCTEHGASVEPVLEWHPGGGIRCTHLARSRSAAAASAPSGV